MTHCYNCGYAGTFVLLAEFALAVPGPIPGRAFPDDSVEDRPTATGGDLSFTVQCPACDSTDVGVAALDLLACYGSSTTS